MPRRAIPVAQTKTGMTNETKAARAETEAEWRRGALSDYEPIGLTESGMAIFAELAAAVPENALCKVDGYTVEAAADAIDKLRECRETIGPAPSRVFLPRRMPNKEVFRVGLINPFYGMDMA